MASTTVPRDLKNLVKLASAQGWSFERTSKGHVKLCPPDGGRAVFYSGTPSDRRAHHNFLAELRRSGMEIPRSFKS